MKLPEITRRGLFKGFAAAGAVAASPSLAQAQSATRPLPARGEFIIRDAYIMTMDPALGDIPSGSVHVKNGVIAAVGKDIKAPSRATIIDGHRTIVLPGLIDTHWHMWTSYMRSMAGDKPADGYFPITTRYGKAMEPIDMYRSTRLACAEAINAGITTVGDNCHNVRSHDHAVQDIRAHQETGVRCRWSYGPYRGMTPDQHINLEDLEGFHRDWDKYSNGGLMSLGFAWGGIPLGDEATKYPERLETARKEFETARRLGIPMATHWASRENTPGGQVEALVKGGFCGKDVLLIHMLATTPPEMKMVAEAGSPISCSPGSELRIGYGLTKACDFMDAGINVAVSVDTVPLTGDANLFGILKLMRNAENAKAFNEFKLTARRALEIATIHGARALQMDHLTGSLTPGKRADVIMVKTDSLHMGVFTDPAHMLVEAAEEADIDTVSVDGRILKRAGKLTALDPERVIAEAAETLETVGKRIS
ncbi:MAG TPA: amidohydrolase family protein [Bryobacteraceae bacterium]|nr:amidohydrolase family protein [Bryobacteraceae bacterium]